MRALGIDLSARDPKTPPGDIEGISERALAEPPRVGRSNTELLEEVERANGITQGPPPHPAPLPP